MQFKLAFITSAILVSFAAATPTPSARNEPASSCTTGSIQCCDSVVPATDATATKVLSLLGIVLQDLNVLVGLVCDPISLIGVSAGGCTAQSVCCEDNNYDGLISIGCVPVDP
ncbi:hypothetical protein GYMLUDRAFT_250097 [Collybiopsis luxurians FD-317 M1]|uniref:Hydrophobin n=1 Tax=Collybiopsis luxurians FD-317 M1 TaxID=944289 RepID=A0A0D0ATG9_9AGAR|nr:hypothetical protein GYMLUDRAFT_250097 [Collybiopsis luxurians FD-317 M1]